MAHTGENRLKDTTYCAHPHLANAEENENDVIMHQDTGYRTAASAETLSPETSV